MSIKIHHGPNGSYKSAGAVQDDMIPAWLDGRVIITNCRGVSADRFSCVLGVPETVGGEVIYLDGETEEGRTRIATWFHWAPEGALIFVDEAQAVWPKSWTQVDLRKLDYPGGSEKAEQDGRPHCYSIAWEKHRHWNWDFVLTTPNIKKIRDEIRECADGGYKHKNLALIGWSGRYVEGFHSPQDNGMSKTDFVAVVNKRIKKNVFKCYDSTKTGKVSDTISGSPLWKNPRVLLLALILAGVGGFVSTRSTPESLQRILGSEPPASAPVHSGRVVPVVADIPQARIVPAAAGGPPPALRAIPQTGGFRGDGPFLDDMFPGAVLAYGGSIRLGSRVNHLLIVRDSAGERVLNSADLMTLGVYLLPVGDCMAQLLRGDQRMLLLCSRVDSMRADSGLMAPEYSSAASPALEPVAAGNQSGHAIRSSGTYSGIPPGR